MKALKLNLNSKFIKIFMTLVLFGCLYQGYSSEFSTELASRESTFSQNILVNQVYNAAEWNFGEVVYVQDQNDFYQVSEILLDNASKARGYLVAHQNINSIYLLDVNTERRTIEIYDFNQSEKIVFTGIDNQYFEDESYAFNLIKNISENENADRHPQERFWGWSCGNKYTSEDDDNCYRTCCYFIMWSSQGCSEYFCEKLPSDNLVINEK